METSDFSDGDTLIFDTTQLEGFKSNQVFASRVKNIEIPDISWVTT
jgi:hypothetical protein